MKKLHSIEFYFLGLLKKEERLIDLLLHKNWEVREKAIKTLNRFNPSWRSGKKAQGRIPELTTALKDGDRGARAALALGLIGDKDSVESLISATKHANHYVRSAACEALGAIRGESAAEPLVTALKDENEYVRASAAEALEKIGDELALVPLIMALKDKSGHVRKTAAGALAKFRNERAVSPLIEALKDSSIRGAVAKTLGRIGNSRAVDPLIGILHDSREHVRVSTAEALGLLGDRCATEPLVALVNDKLAVKRAAAEALGRIGDERAAKPLIAMMQKNYSKIEIVETVSDALAAIGNGCAIKPLIAAYEITFVEKTRKALQHLMALNEPYVIEYPNLFCKKCRRRPVALTRRALFTSIGTLTKSKNSFVYCPDCYDLTNFLTGIKHVTGLIGGDLQKLHGENGTLWVPLWKESEKKANCADIDSLIIRDGIENYEFAINAVIIELGADATKKKNWMKKIPVCVEGNPAISKGAVNILKDNFNWTSEPAKSRR